ncbi:hypothetical protein ABPG77_005439 [Micractinium sp. CCAP 211/92]
MPSADGLRPSLDLGAQGLGWHVPEKTLAAGISPCWLPGRFHPLGRCCLLLCWPARRACQSFSSPCTHNPLPLAPTLLTAVASPLAQGAPEDQGRQAGSGGGQRFQGKPLDSKEGPPNPRTSQQDEQKTGGTGDKVGQAALGYASRQHWRACQCERRERRTRGAHVTACR